MTTEPLTGCALALSAADLSAWHDSVLDEAERARLDAHIPNCSTCQARVAAYDAIARDLRAIHTPAPSRGFGQDPRITAMTHTPGATASAPAAPATPHGARPRATQRRALTGLGAVAAILLLTLGFAQILGRLGGQLPTASGTVTPVIPTATALPSHEATLPAFKTMSVAAGWGKQGLVASIPTTQTGANTSFIPSALLPDGSALIGQIYDARTGTGQLAEWVIATGAVKPLASPAAQPLGAIMTDGRYAVYLGDPGCQCLSVYDLDAGGVAREIRINPVFGGPPLFDHGLFIQQGVTGGITVINVATGSQSAFPDASVATWHAQALAFSWPYLAYIPDPTATTLPGALAVRDLATGQQANLAKLAPLLPTLQARLTNSEGNPGVAVSARALYLVTRPSASSNQLYALEGFMTSTPTLLPIAGVSTCPGQNCLTLDGADTVALGMRLDGTPAAYVQDVGVAVTYNWAAMTGEVTSHYMIFMGPTTSHDLGPYSVLIFDTNLIPDGGPLIKP